MLPNMLAASTCIATAVVVFNPLDCLRLRWQVQNRHATLRAHVSHILRREGLVRGLWAPGVGSNAVGAAVCRGIGMGCYPTVRDWLDTVRSSSSSSSSKKSSSTMFLAGLLSGGLGYGISTPAWLVKARLQAGMETTGGPPYRHGFEGVRHVFAADGIRGLYRGAAALIARGALMNAGNTLGYDFTKTYNQRHTVLPEGPALHVVASVVAAFLSSTFSVPADFVLTRYQAASQMGRMYTGVLGCVAACLREEGPGAFFRGWTPLFVRVCPLYIAYLPVYEQVRMALGLGYLN